MKTFFYVAKDVAAAVAFIKVNTQWRQVTNVAFRNGDERIIVISEFIRIRGRKVDGVYIDHSFTEMKDNVRTDFIKRFGYLGVTPIKIEEKNETK